MVYQKDPLFHHDPFAMWLWRRTSPFIETGIVQVTIVTFLLTLAIALLVMLGLNLL